MIKRALGMLLFCICMSQEVMAYAHEGSAETVLSEDEMVQVVAPGELEEIDSIERYSRISEKENFLMSDNEGDNDYTWYWGKVMNSYLTTRGNGLFTRVEYVSDGNVYIEDYSKDFELTERRTISAELPLFGGFYDDGRYYYLVFGQENMEENDYTEVFRVVKYSHTWQRLGAASIYGANTIVPFAAGSLRCAHYDGYLYVRTCHKMYTASDGLNHQANVTMKIKIADMSVADIGYIVQNIAVGYVSHSFNQFIKVDDGVVYALDHGDYYPRSAVLVRYDNTNFGTWNSSVDVVDTVIYANYDNYHYNYTFATLGGFEVSDTSVLTAGSSAPQDGVNRYKNIYVTATDKDNFSESGTQMKWITNNTDTSADIGNPQLVEINKNNYLLLWTSCGDLKYLRLDGRGNTIGSIVSCDGALSDCQPVYDSTGNRVVWYVTDGYDLIFYSIDANTWQLNKKAVEDKPPVSGWSFVDVAENPGNWKYEAVKYVTENGIMNGTGANEFKPDEPLTRAMFATMLYRMAGQPAVSFSNKFPDVAEGTWYSDAVIWASQKGIVTGYPNGNYGTYNPITREQMAKMLMEYGRMQKYDVSQNADFGSFADDSIVSDWAVDYMKWAVGSGIIGGSQKNGKYYLNPDGNATRAESATMLKRFMEKYE